MASEVLVFGVAALVVVLGYLGYLLFRRLHIPYFLFLLFVGVVVGPILGLADRSFLLPNPRVFRQLYSYDRYF